MLSILLDTALISGPMALCLIVVGKPKAGCIAVIPAIVAMYGVLGMVALHMV